MYIVGYRVGLGFEHGGEKVRGMEKLIISDTNLSGLLVGCRWLGRTWKP